MRDIRTEILSSLQSKRPALLHTLAESVGLEDIKKELFEMCGSDLADKAKDAAEILNIMSIFDYASRVVACSGSYPESPRK